MTQAPRLIVNSGDASVAVFLKDRDRTEHEWNGRFVVGGERETKTRGNTCWRHTHVALAGEDGSHVHIEFVLPLWGPDCLLTECTKQRNSKVVSLSV